MVAIQPDLGTSIIILLAGLLPVIISGFPWIYIFFGGFLVTLSLPLIWISLYDYQKQRILTLFNPEADVYGAGWNIVQSKIAVGSGGLFGKGFLNGSQSQLNFIPESHSDFIFFCYCRRVWFTRHQHSLFYLWNFNLSVIDGFILQLK